MQVSKLRDSRKPIRFESLGPVEVLMVRDRGRLWVNDSTHCLVRTCMLPENSIVTFNPDTGYLDITVVQDE